MQAADLSLAATCLSDAAVLADAYRRRPWQTQLLPYVAALAGRGVVTHNRHPAPARKAMIRKPQLYAVEREGAERMRRTSAAFHSLEGGGCSGGGGGGGGAGSGGGGRFGGSALATDVVPFLRVLAHASYGRPETAPRLTDAQWKAMVELTTFGGRPPPPRGLPPPHNSGAGAMAGAPSDPRAGPLLGAAAAAGAAPMIEEDEIEE